MKKTQNNFIKDLRAAIHRLEEGGQLQGDELASLISAITIFEIEEGGPYSITPEFGVKNADIGFNLLIAYFLLLCEVELPKLNEFLEERSERATSDFLTTEELQDLLKNWRGTRSKNAKSQTDVTKVYTLDEQKMIDMIMIAAEKRFAGFSDEFQKYALQCIQKTIKGNRDKQMSLMAYFTKQSLGKKAEKISDKTIAEMGLANIFFWTAFIIYDDFWDEDEAADPRILPVANMFARHYVDFFSSLFPKETGFRDFYHTLMDNLDGANNWETIHCRAEVRGSTFIIPDELPDYGDYEFKYRPASGHILGPVAVLMQMGYTLDSPEVKNFISYFKNYLIAMQINDDSHDWEEDLRRGHISTVVAMLLKDLNWPKKEIDLDADLLELKKVFWFKTIARAAQKAVDHTERSRQALRSISVFEDVTSLERIIVVAENAAKKALDEQKKSMDFLNTFGV